MSKRMNDKKNKVKKISRNEDYLLSLDYHLAPKLLPPLIDIIKKYFWIDAIIEEIQNDEVPLPALWNIHVRNGTFYDAPRISIEPNVNSFFIDYPENKNYKKLTSNLKIELDKISLFFFNDNEDIYNKGTFEFSNKYKYFLIICYAECEETDEYDYTTDEIIKKNYILAFDNDGNYMGIFDLKQIAFKLGASYFDLTPQWFGFSDGIMCVSYTHKFPYVVAFNKKDIVLMIYSNLEGEPATRDNIKKIEVDRISDENGIKFVVNKNKIIMAGMTLYDSKSSSYLSCLVCCDIKKRVVKYVELSNMSSPLPFICEENNELCVLTYNNSDNYIVIVFDLDFRLINTIPLVKTKNNIGNDEDIEIGYVESYGVNSNGNIYLKQESGETMTIKRYI
jgi:hypothetical protein